MRIAGHSRLKLITRAAVPATSLLRAGNLNGLLKARFGFRLSLGLGLGWGVGNLKLKPETLNFCSVSFPLSRIAVARREPSSFSHYGQRLELAR